MILRLSFYGSSKLLKTFSKKVVKKFAKRENTYYLCSRERGKGKRLVVSV